MAPITAKGKREPLVAWRLDGVDPTAPGHRRRLDLPMIGREAELDLLRWAIDRTDQTGLHLADADIERAAAEAGKAVEIAETGDWVLLAAEARLCLARALGAAGDPAQAAEQAQAASRLATAKEYAAGIAEADALLRVVS